MAKISSRRNFLRVAAAVPAISSVEIAGAQEPVNPQVEALAQDVQLRYGQYLNGEDMADVKRGIARMLRNAETLAKVKTTNSDAPDFLFHPDGFNS